jgi:hypothetical protein
MDALLPVVLEFSSGASLMRFELTSKLMQQTIVPRVICSGAPNNPLLLRRQQPVHVTRTTTGYTLLCMERNVCMMCKKEYYGDLHPDFQLYAHQKCIKTVLHPHTDLPVSRVLLSYVLRAVPFTVVNKKIMLLTERHPGFPRVTVADWCTGTDTEVLCREGSLRSDMYRRSNDRSSQRVRYMRTKQKRLAWEKDADTYCTAEFGKLYKQLKRELHPDIFYYTSGSLYRAFQTQTASSAVDRVNMIIGMQRVFSIEYMMTMFRSGVNLSAWAHLTSSAVVQDFLCTLPLHRIFDVAIIVHEAYSRPVPPGSNITMLLKYAIMDGRPNSYIQQMLSL